MALSLHSVLAMAFDVCCPKCNEDAHPIVDFCALSWLRPCGQDWCQETTLQDQLRRVSLTVHCIDVTCNPSLFMTFYQFSELLVKRSEGAVF